MYPDSKHLQKWRFDETCHCEVCNNHRKQVKIKQKNLVFWYVYCPEKRCSPQRKHWTYKDALAEADRICRIEVKEVHILKCDATMSPVHETLFTARIDPES